MLEELCLDYTNYYTITLQSYSCFAVLLIFIEAELEMSRAQIDHHLSISVYVVMFKHLFAWVGTFTTLCPYSLKCLSD